MTHKEKVPFSAEINRKEARTTAVRRPSRSARPTPQGSQLQPTYPNPAWYGLSQVEQLTGAAHSGDPLLVVDAMLFSMTTGRSLDVVLSAKWDQFIFDTKKWLIPTGNGVEVIPLSKYAFSLLLYRKKHRRVGDGGNHVFVSRFDGEPLQSVLNRGRGLLVKPDF